MAAIDNAQNYTWQRLTLNGVEQFLDLPIGTPCSARPLASSLTPEQKARFVTALPTVAGYQLRPKNCDIDLANAVITDVVLGSIDTPAPAVAGYRLKSTFTY